MFETKKTVSVTVSCNKCKTKFPFPSEQSDEIMLACPSCGAEQGRVGDLREAIDKAMATGTTATAHTTSVVRVMKIKCAACGIETELPPDAADETEVTCPACGKDLGRVANFKKAAEKALAENVPSTKGEEPRPRFSLMKFLFGK